MILSFVDNNLELCWLRARCDMIHYSIREKIISKLDLLHFVGCLDELKAVPSVKLVALRSRGSNVYTMKIDTNWSLVFQYDTDIDAFRGIWLKDESENRNNK